LVRSLLIFIELAPMDRNAVHQVGHRESQPLRLDYKLLQFVLKELLSVA